MTLSDYGNSGAPTEGTVKPEERAAATEHVTGTKTATEQFSDEIVQAPGNPELVAFVASSEHANRDWLVVQGTPVYKKEEGATSPGMRSRDGDVWAKFVDGILVTDDPRVIAWCDENTKICRRADDPMTKSWATIKALQARRANREQILDSSEMDADASFPVGGAGELVTKAEAAKSNSAGDTLVESALLTKETLEQRATERA